MKMGDWDAGLEIAAMVALIGLIMCIFLLAFAITASIIALLAGC